MKLNQRRILKYKTIPKSVKMMKFGSKNSGEQINTIHNHICLNELSIAILWPPLPIYLGFRCFQGSIYPKYILLGETFHIKRWSSLCFVYAAFIFTWMLVVIIRIRFVSIWYSSISNIENLIFLKSDFQSIVIGCMDKNI